jgi:preprotein translocase subunit SecG
VFHIILGIHLVLCVFLVILVLLQQGKGADAGAALGGGGSNTLFGATGATNLMVRITTGTAVLFMITSIFLIRGYEKAIEAGPGASVDVTDPGLGEAVPPAAAPEAAKPAEGAPAAPAPEASK